MAGASPPNILLLMTDQHRYDAVGCNGAPVCRTPAIDRLASDGLRFTQAYTPISLCSPARASLLTGLFAHNHGLLSNMGDFNGVFDTQLLARTGYPTLLRAAGYRVGHVGKWHLPADGDARWGITDFLTSQQYQAAAAQRGIDVDRAREVQRLEWGPDAPFCGRSLLPAEELEEYWVAERTRELLDTYARDGQRFMLCASFFGPHFPYAVPAPYDRRYDPALVARWPNFGETFANKPSIQAKEQRRWNAGHLTWPDWQRVIAHYWGYCTFIDDQIGRILAQLEAVGLSDSTVVIFTTDHGDLLGSHRLFNKGPMMYDETYHIPLLIRWPGVTTGGQCPAMVGLTDLMPTLLEIAGLTPPPGLDGRSLLAWLRGATPSDWPDDIYAEFHGYESTLFSQRMVRTTDWKYIYNPAAEDELYDLASDPGELTNLATSLGHEPIRRRLQARLVRWLERSGDTIIAEDDWKGCAYGLIASGRER